MAANLLEQNKNKWHSQEPRSRKDQDAPDAASVRRRDALRLRRLKTQLLTASAHEGMHAILRRFLDWQLAEQVAQMWALREKSAVVKAEAVLASAGLTTESVIAQTLAL